MRVWLVWAAALLSVAACAQTIEHDDGDGALVALGGDEITVATTTAQPGETWAAGSWPLCRATGEPLRLVSITPEEVKGEVEVEAVRVREGEWAGPTETPENTPIGVQNRPIPTELYSEPEGFQIQPRCGGARFVEVAAQLRMAGENGGALDGLRVVYERDGRQQQFVMPVEFVICGRGTQEEYVGTCEPESS